MSSYTHLHVTYDMGHVTKLKISANDLHCSYFLLAVLFRRTALSKSNGKICRTTVELLSRHLQNEGIVEYGFRTLSFLLFVAVSVELRALQHVRPLDANKLNAKSSIEDVDRRGMSIRSANALHIKSTTQYMQEIEAVQLSVKALLKLTNPDGTITSTVRAVTSILLVSVTCVTITSKGNSSS